MVESLTIIDITTILAIWGKAGNNAGSLAFFLLKMLCFEKEKILIVSSFFVYGEVFINV